MKIDGKLRYISWGDATHYDCSGKIESVQEKYKGKVQLEDEQEFENGEGLEFENPEHTALPPNAYTPYYVAPEIYSNQGVREHTMDRHMNVQAYRTNMPCCTIYTHKLCRVKLHAKAACNHCSTPVCEADEPAQRHIQPWSPYRRPLQRRERPAWRPHKSRDRSMACWRSSMQRRAAMVARSARENA